MLKVSVSLNKVKHFYSVAFTVHVGRCALRKSIIIS